MKKILCMVFALGWGSLQATDVEVGQLNETGSPNASHSYSSLSPQTEGRHSPEPISEQRIQVRDQRSFAQQLNCTCSTRTKNCLMITVGLGVVSVLIWGVCSALSAAH